MFRIFFLLGKIAVIDGCLECTGAPYFAAISALKMLMHAFLPIGAVLSHVFCTKDAAPVIKSYSPQLIVHPILEESCSIGIGGVTILRKGKSDLISDGEIVQSVTIYGSPRHCGGRGDILSGSVAVFLSWANQYILAAEGNLAIRPTNPTVLECIAGSALLRRAASLAFENRKRSTLTSDIIECLGRRFVTLTL
ncbi:hypothetical protein GH714_019504 [Hevea brasiliensis]|uniref:YjeF C-terminal domain-containing protein n=1 Tax=Hevea brasiliensis TaxID=3981 RepID=A0A6A6K5S0_HEVBR|nr:hypothetical protein GH714_019504 [Hevea brasiliensis]